MKTQILPQENTLDFKGLGEWFEVFEGGPQTSSNGKKVNLSNDEIDKAIELSQGEDIPLVVGHPKTNDPAYGWANEYKREGDKLFSRAHSYAQEFSDAVEAKHFPKRSISFVKTDDGYKIRHIGFLGAVPPAVKTLADIEFNQDQNDHLVFDFAMSESERREVSFSLSNMARIARKWRENLIEKLSIEEADKIIAPYEIDSLEDSARSIRHPDNPHEFSESNTQTTHTNQNTNTDGDNTMSTEITFSQADMDAKQKEIDDLKAKTAKEKRDLAFSQAKSDASVLVTGYIKEGRLLPAQAQGEQLADFMAHLKVDESVVIEFSEGDTQKQKSAYTFFSEFLGGLGKQINLGKDDSEDADTRVSEFSEEQDAERREFAEQAEKLATEKNISFSQALNEVLS